MKKTVKNELQALSVEDLRHKVELLRRDLFSSRLHSTTRPLKDKTAYKKMRRDIARALTFIRQKSAQV